MKLSCDVFRRDSLRRQGEKLFRVFAQHSRELFHHLVHVVRVSVSALAASLLCRPLSSFSVSVVRHPPYLVYVSGQSRFPCPIVRLRLSRTEARPGRDPKFIGVHTDARRRSPKENDFPTSFVARIVPSSQCSSDTRCQTVPPTSPPQSGFGRRETQTEHNRTGK